LREHSPDHLIVHLENAVIGADLVSRQCDDRLHQVGAVGHVAPLVDQPTNVIRYREGDEIPARGFRVGAKPVETDRKALGPIVDEPVGERAGASDDEERDDE